MGPAPRDHRPRVEVRPEVHSGVRVGFVGLAVDVEGEVIALVPVDQEDGVRTLLDAQLGLSPAGEPALRAGCVDRQYWSGDIENVVDLVVVLLLVRSRLGGNAGAGEEPEEPVLEGDGRVDHVVVIRERQAHVASGKSVELRIPDDRFRTLGELAQDVVAHVRLVVTHQDHVDGDLLTVGLDRGDAAGRLGLNASLGVVGPDSGSLARRDAHAQSDGSERQTDGGAAPSGTGEQTCRHSDSLVDWRRR